MSDMWNGVAPAWEQNAAFVDAHLHSVTEALLDAVDVRRGADVLDLATGPGGAGLAAAERVGTFGSVILADVAREMVRVAVRRAAGRARISTLVCDQSAIDAPDASFDVVIVRHGLMFAEDPVQAVREARRVLRPGGRYGAMVWGPQADNPWLGLILDAVGAQFGIPFPPPSVPGPFSLAGPEHLTDVLGQAGLEQLTVAAVPAPMSVESLDAWWERVPQLAGPLAAALAGMDAAVRQAIRERALATAARSATASPDGIVLQGSVLIATGRKPKATGDA